MTLKAFIAIMVSPINHYGEVVDLPADAYQENDRLARLFGIWAYLSGWRPSENLRRGDIADLGRGCPLDDVRPVSRSD
jgi:hypothetical protein